MEMEKEEIERRRRKQIAEREKIMKLREIIRKEKIDKLQEEKQNMINEKMSIMEFRNKIIAEKREEDVK